MDQLDCALDLMRRMPPSEIEENLAGLLDLVPDLMENLLSAVDQPLKIETDPETGRDYLLCDYNRDGDSYRAPISNKYYPPLEDGYEGTFPSDKLRELELKANAVFDTYREMYYESGVSSVYTWDLDDGFAMVVLIKKVADGSGKKGTRGTWDSIHVCEVTEEGQKAKYKLTSTVMLNLTTNTAKTGDLVLSGSLTDQSETEGSLDPKKHSNPHIVHIGRAVEAMEGKMRNALDQVYFGKTKDIIMSSLRSGVGLDRVNMQRNLASAAFAEMQQRRKK